MIPGNKAIWSVRVLVLTGLILLMPLNPAAEYPMADPWNWPTKGTTAEQPEVANKKPSIVTGFFTTLLTFFSDVISPVDGDRCPSYPTCAAYSKQAYNKHGAVLGTLMTVDRLFHEPDAHRFAPVVEVHGVKRIYDPVSANEFWKKDHKAQVDKAGR
jgi:putative component of membrane protein insertase Oxa1/YidC/SpoIIIJ protein YidD